MRHSTFLRCAAASAALYFASQANANAALVAAGDEWMFTNDAYARQNADTTRLVGNLAGVLGGTKYLIVSNGWGNDSGLPNLTMLQSALAALGKTVTTSTTYSTSLLAGEDAVLLFGFAQGANDTANLAAYVNNGGSLLVSLGTGGLGTAAAEANAWNPLLNQFGLNAGNDYMPVAAFYDAPVIQGATALDDGVGTLVWGFGQTISELNPANPQTGLVVANFGSVYGAQGGIGVYTAQVPEPAGYALLLAGVVGMGAAARRRKLRKA